MSGRDKAYHVKVTTRGIQWPRVSISDPKSEKLSGGLSRKDVWYLGVEYTG